MGKSRSSTVLIAYLLWASNRAHAAHPTPDPNSDTTNLPPQPLDFDSALALVRRGRPLCEPNDGFEEQLKLYHQMGCPDDITTHPLYQRWLYRRNVQESLSVNQAPGMDVVRFEDEHEYENVGDGIAAPTAETDPGSEKSPMDLKCRKCRRLLAKSTFTVEHKPPQGKAIADCQHIFLHPLSWMKEALEAGELEGRLTCPNEKCGANVGKYSWQGMRCNCGGWETPVFAVARSRVDEAPARQSSAASTVPEGGAVRLPPGMRRAGGENL